MYYGKLVWLWDSTDNSSNDKVETSLEQQQYFSQFQDTTDALPCHIHLPVCLCCELWTLTVELKRRIQAMEKRCYCKILHISYKDHVTNEEVRAKIQQAIRAHKGLLTIVKRRKLQWYGHVSCSSGLAKTTLQGMVKGGRRQGGQRKRWEDNIREWTGLEFSQVPEGSGEQGKMEKTGCEIICGAPTTLAVKGEMTMR